MKGLLLDMGPLKLANSAVTGGFQKVACSHRNHEGNNNLLLDTSLPNVNTLVCSFFFFSRSRWSSFKTFTDGLDVLQTGSKNSVYLL